MQKEQMTDTTSTPVPTPTPTPTPKTRIKRKRTKVKSPFKKANTAYIVFRTEHQAALKIAHPEYTFGQISKHFSVEWEKLTDKDKEPYQKKSNQLKLEANAYNESIRKNHPELIKEWNERKNSVKPPKKMRKTSNRSPNVFILFANYIRPQVVAENPGKIPAEIQKIIGAMWRGFTNEEKIAAGEKAKANLATKIAEAAEAVEAVKV